MVRISTPHAGRSDGSDLSHPCGEGWWFGSLCLTRGGLEVRISVPHAGRSALRRAARKDAESAGWRLRARISGPHAGRCDGSDLSRPI